MNDTLKILAIGRNTLYTGLIASCLVLLIIGVPSIVIAQTVTFEEGSAEIKFRTNIVTKSGSHQYFTTKKNPVLDFTGVENPAIYVVIVNVKWKKDYQEKDGYYFVSKNEWINESKGLLEKATKKNIKTKSKGKRTINFIPKSSGETSIKVDFGIMTPEMDGDINSVKKIPGKSVTKSFTVKGLGVKEVAVKIEEPKSGDPHAGDPHGNKPKSETKTPVPDKKPVTNTTDPKVRPSSPVPTQQSTSDPVKTTIQDPIVKSTPVPVKVPKAEVKQEDSFWKKVKEASSYTMYRKYISRFPNGKHISLAESGIKKTDIKFKFKEQREDASGDYIYKIELDDVETPEIVETYNQDNLEAYLLKKMLTVTIKTSGKQEISVKDGYGRRVTIPMNPEFKLLNAKFYDEADFIKYEIWGGTPPYYLRVVDAVTDRRMCANHMVPGTAGGGRTIGQFSKEDLATVICDLNGTYKFEVLDRRKTEVSYYEDEFPLKGRSNASTYGMMLVLVLLPIVAFGAYFFNQKRKEKERDEYFKKYDRRNKDKKNVSTDIRTETKVENAPAKTIQPIKEEPNTVESVNSPTTENNEQDNAVAESKPVEAQTNVEKKAKTKINVISRKGGAKQTEETLVFDESNYCPIDLTRMWGDSAVKDIYLSRNSISSIDEFIRKENREGIDEDVNQVPEVGGFLLGNYEQDDNGFYKIFLEKFVPITPEQNDVYKVEFGVEAWVELDNVKDQNPDYMLLGWFHTHPGHSLFLSQPDLKIHEGFFKHNFQIAMEIDTLTENLDTGFFVRTKDGMINNTRDLIEGEEWDSWIEIEKFLRKKRS